MIRAAILSVLVVSGAVAQPTTGVPGQNDLTINGVGSGQTSCVPMLLGGGPTTLTFEISALPGTLVLGAWDPVCAPDTITLGNGLSVDLSPSLVIWYGTGASIPTLPNPSNVTNSNGQWALAFATDTNGDVGGIQFALINPAYSPVPLPGTPHLSLTQAFDIASPMGTAAICTGADSITTLGGVLSDDGSFNYPFSNPAGFPFYGTTFTDVWLNMNGNVTFCSGDTDFSPTPLEMASDQPRITGVWDDWTPPDADQGDVLIEDLSSQVSFEWRDVRHFSTASCSQSAGFFDSNTMCTTLDLAGGGITIQIGEMRLCAPPYGNDPSLEQIVGISAGLDSGCPLLGTGNVTSVDLALGPGLPNANATVAAGDPLFEFFDATNPFDLSTPGLGGSVQTTLTFTSLGGGHYTQN